MTIGTNASFSIHSLIASPRDLLAFLVLYPFNAQEDAVHCPMESVWHFSTNVDLQSFISERNQMPPRLSGRLFTISERTQMPPRLGWRLFTHHSATFLAPMLVPLSLFPPRSCSTRLICRPAKTLGGILALTPYVVDSR